MYKERGFDMDETYYYGPDLSAEQIRTNKAYFDRHFILPADEEKLILYVPLTIFGCFIRGLGIVGSVGLFILWLIKARRERNEIYRNSVYSWKTYSADGVTKYLSEGGTF